MLLVIYKNISKLRGFKEGLDKMVTLLNSCFVCCVVKLGYIISII